MKLEKREKKCMQIFFPHARVDDRVWAHGLGFPSFFEKENRTQENELKKVVDKLV